MNDTLKSIQSQIEWNCQQISKKFWTAVKYEFGVVEIPIYNKNKAVVVIYFYDNENPYIEYITYNKYTPSNQAIIDVMIVTIIRLYNQKLKQCEK